MSDELLTGVSSWALISPSRLATASPEPEPSAGIEVRRAFTFDFLPRTLDSESEGEAPDPGFGSYPGSHAPFHSSPTGLRAPSARGSCHELNGSRGSGSGNGA